MSASLIRGPWSTNYSTAGGYKAEKPGETGTLHSEVAMRRIDRLFVRLDRYSDRQLTTGVVVGVAGFWLAFAVFSAWALVTR